MSTFCQLCGQNKTNVKDGPCVRACNLFLVKHSLQIPFYNSVAKFLSVVLDWSQSSF